MGQIWKYKGKHYYSLLQPDTLRIAEGKMGRSAIEEIHVEEEVELFCEKDGGRHYLVMDEERIEISIYTVPEFGDVDLGEPEHWDVIDRIELDGVDLEEFDKEVQSVVNSYAEGVMQN